MSTTEHSAGPSADQPDGWLAVQRSADFQGLRRRFRRFIFPMTVLFLAWYLGYVGLAAYAPEFMSSRVADSNITVGLLIGLGQFVSTFLITMVYAWFANRHLDPVSSRIRDEVEAEVGGVRR